MPCFKVLHTEAERQGLLPREPSSPPCPSATTSLTRPAQWSSSLSGGRATPGPKGGCSPSLSSYHARELPSSPCTSLVLSRGATLPKITSTSSPSAAAAIYSFITHIGDTNYSRWNQLLPCLPTTPTLEPTAGQKMLSIRFQKPNQQLALFHQCTTPSPPKPMEDAAVIPVSAPGWLQRPPTATEAAGMSPLALTPSPGAGISAFFRARRGAVGAGAAGVTVAASQDFNYFYFYSLSQ